MNSKVFISGGGPVGLILAIGLSQLGAEVILAEKNLPDEMNLVNSNKSPDSSFDGRVIALTYGSKLILEKLGVWEQIYPFTTKIKSVHVSQKGFLGITHLHAKEVDLPALGYSITASDLGKVLWQRVQSYQQIQVLCPANLESLEMTDNQANLSVSVEGQLQKFTVDLVVGADGTQSTVRQLLDLEMTVKDYHAVGVIAKIETELSPNNWAYERFTKEGAVALLPMGGNFSKAVLVCPKEQVEHVKTLGDEAFMQLFASKMGERLGRFTQVSERVFYPLQETYVPQMTKGRAVLMGNASHTQHPVAAQGLNLGIVDIQAFLDLSESLLVQNLGDTEFLQTYAKQRHQHHQQIMGLTDSLIEIFQAKSPVIGHARGIGLMAMQTFSPLRKRFAKISMGVSL